MLAEENLLPSWLNPWSLGSLLHDSKRLHYLGRNVVKLRSESTDENSPQRMHIAPLIAKHLQEHGGPMPEDELRQRVSEQRGLSIHTWALLRHRIPFLPLDNGLIGLAPRDIPGGAAAAAQLIDALCEHLAARGRSLTRMEQQRWLRERGALEISPTLLRSLARHDPRLCVTKGGGGGVGLACWESARVPTQREQLQALLHEHHGEVPLSLAQDCLQNKDGTPLSRAQLSTLARAVNARVFGHSIHADPPLSERHTPRS